MKTLIRVLIVVALVLAGFLGTWAVLQKYENYKLDQKIAERQAENKVKNAEADAKEAAEAEMSRLRVSYEIVRQECLKGKAAYDSLSTFNQSTLSAPSCGKALEN